MKVDSKVRRIEVKIDSKVRRIERTFWVKKKEMSDKKVMKYVIKRQGYRMKKINVKG